MSMIVFRYLHFLGLTFWVGTAVAVAAVAAAPMALESGVAQALRKVTLRVTTPAMLLALLLSVPPLTDEQRVRLETAYDGRDHQEEAFVALLDNVRSVGDDDLVRLRPDPDRLVAEPEAFRGDLCRLVGRIEQKTGDIP